MSLEITHVMPAVMLILVILFILFVTFHPQSSRGNDTNFLLHILPWQVPALVSFAFFGWSVYTVIKEGFLGFWAVHTLNGFWGNQVWFDLLFCVALAWTTMLPKARALNMNIILWLIFVLSTASIGLLAMLSRILYLEQQALYTQME